MGDLLASASLLLTLIGLLYALWYPEIVQALDIKKKPHPQDRIHDHKRVKDVFFSRAVPLAVAAVALTTVFTPALLKIVFNSGRHAFTTGWRAILDYDPVSTSLVLITIGSGLFSWHLVALVRKLHKHVRLLNPKN
jgi:hypothetical protein